MKGYVRAGNCKTMRYYGQMQYLSKSSRIKGTLKFDASWAILKNSQTSTQPNQHTRENRNPDVKRKQASKKMRGKNVYE